MKRALFPFLLMVMLLSSCNSSRLEWWEAVNTPQKRVENIMTQQKRNDDAAYEKALFQKMDEIEAAVSPYRQESWVKSGDKWLVGVSILYYVLTASLILLGIMGNAGAQSIKDSEVRGLGLSTRLISILAVGISIPYMLLVDNATSGGTINFWQLILLVGLILSIPFSLKMFRRAHFGYSELDLGSFAYIVILPAALLLGVFVRKLATFGSYLFLLFMLAEFVVMLVRCIRSRTPFLSTLFILFYVLFVGFGSVFVLYSAISTVAYIAFWVVLLYFIIAGVYGFITDPQSLFDATGGGSSSSSYSDSGSTSFDMDLMRNTYKTDSDGNDVFRNTNGKYYKHSWTGWQETDRPD